MAANISDIFGKSFNILRANPKIVIPYLIFIFIVGTISVATSLSINSTLMSARLSTSLPTAAALYTLTKLAPLLLTVFIISFFVTPLLAGIYISAADQGYRKGKVLLSRAFNVAKRNYVGLLLTAILVIVLWIVIAAILAIIIILPATVLGAVWLVLGAIVGVIVLVLFGIYVYQAYVVVVLENLGPADAIKRSYQIGKQKLRLIFGVFIVTVILTVVYAIADSLVIFLVATIFSLGGSNAALIASQLANFIIEAFYAAWILMVPAAFYIEAGLGKRAATARRKR